MNNTVGRYVLLFLVLLFATLVLSAPLLGAEGYLENPQEAGHESGVGIVSGFHCDAQVIEVKFDDYDPIPAAHGTTRMDTEELCGNSDTGYGLFWNWNLLGPGQHTVRVFADGVEFDSAEFQVSTLGQEWVSGLEIETDLLALGIGKAMHLKWQQGKQNFVVEAVEEADFSLSMLVAALSGSWAGQWYGPTGTGTVGMTFREGPGGYPEASNIHLAGTGCASNGDSAGELGDVNNPIVYGIMDDGSEVEFEIVVTESFSAVGGVFWFINGPCMDYDGIFYMMRN